MQHVTGIGGLFFRAKNPTMMAEWYTENYEWMLLP